MLDRLRASIAFRQRRAAHLRWLRERFRNGDDLVRSFLTNAPCDEAVRRDGTIVRHPAGRTGLAGMILEVWCNEVYTASFYAPAPGDVVIDAGANIGLFSLLVAEREPRARILAFEPYEENSRLLEQNLAAAGARSVRVFRRALSSRSGRASMIDGGERSQDHRVGRSGEAAAAGVVPTCGLAEVLALVGDDPVAMMKCDIEGSEGDLFRAAAPVDVRRVRRIAVEYHDHLRPGTRQLLEEVLAPSHALTIRPAPEAGYGMMYAVRRDASGGAGRDVESLRSRPDVRVRRDGEPAAHGLRDLGLARTSGGGLDGVMRVAAIYDIHGNLPALEAVLDEIGRAGVDRVVVGGDVVPGPMPRETIARLLNLDVPVSFIRGNGDREVQVRMRGGDTDSGPAAFREVRHWHARELAAAHEAVLASWPATVRLAIDGLGDVLFCHATPRSDTEIFTRMTGDAQLRPLFQDLGVRLVVCGHTHMPFDRTIGSVRVVNAGSVGMPFGPPGASWLLIGPDVTFRHTDYDLRAAAARVRATRYPQAEDFAARSILQPPSEQQMLEVFGKADS